MFSKSIGSPFTIIGCRPPSDVPPSDFALEEDVEEGGEPVPGHAHRGVERDHDHPRERDDDLEHRHQVDDGLAAPVDSPEKASPSQKVSGKCRADASSVRRCRAYSRPRSGDDAQADAEDHGLDEVALPHRRAVEPALGAALALLRAARAVADEGDDRDEHRPGEELGDPLVEEEVADQRQRELGVEELAEGREQREEQQPEADEDEPVADPDRRPLQHPGVAQRLLEQRDRAGPGSSVRLAVGWPSLTTAMMCRIAFTNRAMPTAAIASDTTMAKICINAPHAQPHGCLVRRASVEPSAVAAPRQRRTSRARNLTNR